MTAAVGLYFVNEYRAPRKQRGAALPDPSPGERDPLRDAAGRRRHRPAIAVGIRPQLLPAVVSTSLAAGSQRMSRRKVLVKRLMCIEDLGDVEVLFTDKTGTLPDGG